MDDSGTDSPAEDPARNSLASSFGRAASPQAVSPVFVVDEHKADSAIAVVQERHQLPQQQQQKQQQEEEDADDSIPTSPTSAPAGWPTAEVVALTPAASLPLLTSPGRAERARATGEEAKEEAEAKGEGDEDGEITFGYKATDLDAAQRRIERLEKELRAAQLEVRQVKGQRDRFKTKYKEVLWEYLPKQRALSEIPACNARHATTDDDGNFQLRDYRVAHRIGTGSFGEVRAAFRRSNGEKYAVKFLDLKKMIHLSYYTSAEAEIKAMKILNHPNIIRIAEVLHVPDKLLFVMQYLGGGNLYQYMLEHGKLSAFDSTKFSFQITSALAYIHNRGYTHRDLKPENVLLDEGANAVLTDFGLSGRLSPGTERVKYHCGTPGFMAPELSLNEVSVSTPINPFCGDMWSLGCIIVELLCGKNAAGVFSNVAVDNADDLIQRLWATHDMTPQTTPLHGFMHLCLQKEPAKRPTAQRALQHVAFESADDMIAKRQAALSPAGGDGGASSTPKNGGTPKNCGTPKNGGSYGGTTPTHGGGYGNGMTPTSRTSNKQRRMRSFHQRKEGPSSTRAEAARQHRKALGGGAGGVGGGIGGGAGPPSNPSGLRHDRSAPTLSPRARMTAESRLRRRSVGVPRGSDSRPVPEQLAAEGMVAREESSLSTGKHLDPGAWSNLPPIHI